MKAKLPAHHLVGLHSPVIEITGNDYRFSSFTAFANQLLQLVDLVAALTRQQAQMCADNGDTVFQAPVQQAATGKIPATDIVVLPLSKSVLTEDCVAVVALIDNESATLKRFYPDGRRIRLEPRNPELKPITLDSNRVTIQGVVIGVLRRYA